ncbi:DMT family protein, partial [Xanthomonas sp. WHRI 8812E]|uniref:DMT family protein n=1 Tax=Xanthomonas sp. WHRI 8812E TaxID=3059651 RepID=UPI002B23B959
TRARRALPGKPRRARVRSYDVLVRHSSIRHEVIRLLVFAGFSTFYLGQSLKWNHWAAFGLILVAAFLMFKE